MAKARETVALAMIVEGGKAANASLLAQALGSVSGYVDYIVVQLNAPKGKKIRADVRKVAEQYADLVYDYEWKGNFVTARNDSFAKVPKEYDWVCWMDTDDTWVNPELIQPIVNKATADIQGIYVMYDYAHDEYDNVTVKHWVTRIARNNGSFIWKSSIDDDEVSVHETLIANREVNSYGEGSIRVVHHTDSDHRWESLERNIKLLEGMYKRQSAKGTLDPRILYYLAIHLYDSARFGECLDLLIEYLKMSGWAQERSQAHVYIGKILKGREKTQQAKSAFMAAIGENPKNQNAYLEIAYLEFEMQRYDSAVEFLKIGIGIKNKVSPMVQFDNHWQMYALLAECYVNIGGKHLEDAMTYINKAIDLRPYDEMLKDSREKVQFIIDQRDDMRAANRLIRKLDKEEPKKVLRLIENLPKDLADTLPVIAAYQRHVKAKTWPKKSMAIYCGNSTLGLWGPWSLNQGGIGGSEEAVVRLSQQLKKLGWQVTVYGTPGERAGTYNGVVWKQYWELNAKDKFDVLVAWRQPNFFDFKFKARKKYLWLHDVMPKPEMTKERIANFDKAIFVSKYHSERPEFVDIPPEKKFISSNGITPEDFKYDGQLKRDPHRCIYMSANERGLRILYDIWPEVKQAVPKATLDVYYGWHSFDAVNRNNPERMTWKATMQQKAKELDGVVDHGRIGQDEIVKEIYQSGIWAYPSLFPEVNCITGQKAMAGGAVPVTSDFAALKDLVKYGQQVPMGDFEKPDIKRYKEALIEALKKPVPESYRRTMMQWARDEFAWGKTAAGWDKELS
jgi:glycosyltransferase involved in cell wall biosynthesis